MEEIAPFEETTTLCLARSSVLGVELRTKAGGKHMLYIYTTTTNKVHDFEFSDKEVGEDAFNTFLDELEDASEAATLFVGFPYQKYLRMQATALLEREAAL